MNPPTESTDAKLARLIDRVSRQVEMDHPLFHIERKEKLSLLLLVQTMGKALEDGERIIEAARKVVAKGEQCDAPFGMDEQEARLYLAGQASAYLHALEMFSAPSALLTRDETIKELK